MTNDTDDFVRAMFDGLGIRRLSDALDAGWVTDGLDDERVATYANVATVRWLGAPIRYKGGDAQEALADHFLTMLLQVLVGRGPDYVEVGGAPFLRSPTGNVPVTGPMLEHFEWMLTLLTDGDLARRFLDALPDAYREEAARVAGRSWDAPPLT